MECRRAGSRGIHSELAPLEIVIEIGKDCLAFRGVIDHDDQSVDRIDRKAEVLADAAGGCDGYRQAGAVSFERLGALVHGIDLHCAFTGTDGCQQVKDAVRTLFQLEVAGQAVRGAVRQVIGDDGRQRAVSTHFVDVVSELVERGSNEEDSEVSVREMMLMRMKWMKKMW